jgi:hypothetical protein
VLNSAEAGYVAGILDGEGCLTATWNGPYCQPVISVTNTNKVLIDWLHAKLGGSVHHPDPKKRPAHWKSIWNWVITKEGIRRVLAYVRPYLIAKGEEADVLLEMAQLKGRDPRNPALMARLKELHHFDHGGDVRGFS